IQFSRLHGSFVGLHRGFKRGGSSLDLIVLLPRADTLLEQKRVALLFGRGLPVLRPIFGEVRFGLMQRGFEGARIDGEQQVALLNVLSLAEAHLHDLAVNLRLHVHGGESLHAADRMDRVEHRLLRDLGRQDGHRLALAESVSGTVRASGNRNQCERRDESYRSAPLLQREVALQLPFLDNRATGSELRPAKVASRILSGSREPRKSGMKTETALPVSFFREGLSEGCATLARPLGA